MKSEQETCVAAFFDVDNTLVKYNTMFGFHWYYYRRRPARARFPPLKMLGKSFTRAAAFGKFLSWYVSSAGDIPTFNTLYYSGLKGIDKAEYSKLAKQWFLEENIVSTFNRKIVEKLKEHQALNHMIVLVTGSHRPLIEPLESELNVTSVIATDVETFNGRFTGKIANDCPLVGEGKARAMKEYAKKQNVDLARSFAYTDHVSDIQMLETVGNPIPVIGDKRLQSHARKKGWNAIMLS